MSRRVVTISTTAADQPWLCRTFVSILVLSQKFALFISDPVPTWKVVTLEAYLEKMLPQLDKMLAFAYGKYFMLEEVFATFEAPPAEGNIMRC